MCVDHSAPFFQPITLKRGLGARVPTLRVRTQVRFPGLDFGSRARGARMLGETTYVRASFCAGFQPTL